MNNNSDWLEEDGQTNNQLTLKEIVFKYLPYLPLFIISVILCVALAYLYLHFVTPKYEVSESILIKSKLASPSTSNNGASTDLIAVALDGGSSANIDNEIQLLQSASLMEHIVVKNHLNTSYFQIDGFKQTDLYPQTPFQLLKIDSAATEKNLEFVFDNLNKEAIAVTVKSEKKEIRLNLRWNEPFEVEGTRFVLKQNPNTNFDKKYRAIWKPAGNVADEIAGSLSVTIPDKKTTIIKLTYPTENIVKGQDILNWVVKEYNESNIQEKMTLAQNTIRFIDDRLAIVTNELNGVEGNLEGFQGKSRLIDVQTQSTQSFENANDISKNINDIRIQQQVVDILIQYFNDPNAQNKLVPSNLGINDATLISLMTKYNELQAKRQREEPQVAPNSIVLQDIDAQINDVKTSIKENLHNIKKNLQLQESGHRQKDQEYQGFIAALPGKQRVLQDIKRKQTITEGLYLYLLQKREETAISFSSASAATYKQIDPPKANAKSTWSNGKIIKLGAVLLGLLLPLAYIKIREIFHDKIITRSELSAVSKLPVLGEITHISSKFNDGHPLTASAKNIEQFRSLRTAISLYKNNAQTILVTSGGNADGKSLVSSNLAAVLAMPGKKTALLQFDLQNPANPSAEKGLVDFLKGTVNDLKTLYTTTAEIPGLHIFSTGPVPENASDLLLSNKLESLFATLKNEYDYIVVDTAPTGLVSNAFVLGKYSDIALTVIRLRHSARKQIQTLNDIAAKGSLPNMALVINDI